MLILASNSPRRSELLEREGVDFEVRASEVEEIPPNSLPAVELAEENALLKASTVASFHPNSIVLGADTVVVIEGHTLGKPKDLSEATEMLKILSGRWHEVVTGFALIQGEKKEIYHEVTRVQFKELSLQDIEKYHMTVEVLDKAGGYAIQEGGEQIIAKVLGCRDNVMGLPIQKVLSKLEHFNI